VSEHDQPDSGTSSSSTLLAEWQQHRHGTLNVTLGDVIVVAEGTVGGPKHYVLDAEPGSYVIQPATADLSMSGHAPAVVIAPPELAVGFVVEGERTDEGVAITAVTPVWRQLFESMSQSTSAFYDLDPRQMEELVAAAYKADGWDVTLTPRSGDRGRDVIARRDDVGSIRILDQVKRYKPGLLVTAEEVRSMVGVLSMDQRASKAYITTTSGFAPRVAEEVAALTPTRLELRDGNALRSWLIRILQKRH